MSGSLMRPSSASLQSRLRSSLGAQSSQASVAKSLQQAMDPQQRLLLEVTYESLEDAGITLEAIAGQHIGVYVGASQIDYTSLLHKDVQDIPVYQSTGISANILSNRISYVFDLKGPSMTIDTACSSSLAALHTACQGIRSGELSRAIVGGAHILLSPDTMVGMSMLRLLGDDGRSYTYDSRGTGYGRGEGVVSLVLRPLHDALRDGDNVRAIIRNTGANQDGKTAGITFPSCDAQAALIKSVYDAAGLDPVETDYVEAHGTGTAAGDPVEAEAIARTLAKDRPAEKPLLVGSVKSNIGHLEAASGLAAMVKTIMALERDQIPPNFDFRTPNKDIPLDKWKLEIPTSVRPWPTSTVQRASISNFGFGGTNVHVICERYRGERWSLGSRHNGSVRTNGFLDQRGTGHSIDVPHTNGMITRQLHHPCKTTRIPCGPKAAAFQSPKRRLFVLSANDKTSLQERAVQLSEYLKIHPDVDAERLAFTLNHCRSQLEWREAVSAVTPSELADILSSSSSNHTKACDNPRIGFVFTGQGAQWATMGTGLLVYPIFRGTLHEADMRLRSMGASWSLMDEILKDANVSNINRPLLSQPATTAVQIALVNLLSSWEIFPKSVVGHSSGEIAAAYASGALSLNDCMLIAYHRGVLSESLKSKRPERPGGMLAIGAPPTKVRPMIKRLGSARVAIACVNAPSLLTASGDERAILELQSAAEAENLFNRRLKVDVAYHSPHMQDIAEEYSDLLRGVDPQLQTKVKFHSSVKGKMLDTDTLDAEYWVENMTAPVQFLDGVQSLYKDGNGPDVLIELGPHSTLEAPIKDIMKANPGWSSTVRYLPTLVRNKDDTMTTMFLASALYALGVDIDLSAINQTDSTRTLRPLPDLPAYPWNHSKRYWHESRLSVNHQQKPFPYNDLLGDLVDDYNKYEPRWRNILRTVELPWLLDHKVQGSIIFPLTGYLAMALEAMLQYAAMWNIPVTSSTYYNLREITVSRSMVLSEESPTEISFILRPREEGSRNPSKSWYVFTVYSWTGENGWSEHCQGLLSLTQREQISSLANGSEQNNSSGDYYQGAISTRQEICQHTLEPSDIYSRFRRGGLQFGPGFQNITVARVAPNYSMATVTVPDAAKIMPKECERISCIHPETLDSCFQVTALAAGEGFLSSSDIHVPTFIKEFTLKVNTSIMPGQQLLVYANQQHLYGDNDSDIHSSFFAVSPQNQSDILIDVQGFTASKLPSQDAPEVSKGGRGLCYRVHYEPCADFLTPEQIKTVFSAHSKDIHPTRQTEGLEKAAFYYARRLLDDLSPEEVASAPEHLQKLHSALTSLLARSEQEGLPFQTQDWLQSTEEDRGQFLDEHATVDDCGRLLSAMGENLVPIFLEEVEPLSIMLRQNLLERYYRNSSINIRANESSAALISHLAHQNPNMKILEIGAGTGSSTMRILGALGHSFAEYIFTDISPSFFESAKDQQQEWSGKMRYQRLNIEEDPSAQGFEPESYDLILAYSVLHATANLERTMRNVRSLLRPGGKALIGEITLQQLSATVIFGCLPGWWLSEEQERQEGPVLDEVGWDKVLRRSGFSGIDGSVPVNPKGPNVFSIILATAISQQQPTYPEASVVVCDNPHQHLVQAIGEQLSTITKQSSTPTGTLLETDLDDRYGIILALDEPFWPDLDELGLKRMQQLFSSARGILWVSRGAQGSNPGANMATGLARPIRSENAGMRFATLDLDGQQLLPQAQIVDLILAAFKSAFGSNDHPRFFADMEFAELNGMLHVPRILADQNKDRYIVRETCAPVPEPQPFKQPGRPMRLKIGQVGLLDSIHFEDDKAMASSIAANEVQIEIIATGLNFKDLMISLGHIPFYHGLGLECSGIVTAVGTDVHELRVGDRVCAIASGCYAQFVRVPEHKVAKIPQEMSVRHAASIPIIFSTAHYALSEVGRLCRGESILIHAAAGGVGQAAVMLAKRAEAEIFVTVGSVEKKKLIMETYQIPEDHIFASRDTSFRPKLMAMTKQRGVDVVVNSTSGEMLHHSWQCLAPLGRFIEIGKRDLVNNTNLEMEKFAQSATFAAIDLGILADERPHVFKRVLNEVVEMHSQRLLQPVKPLTVLPMSELPQAMRMMQAGKHTGKIVIEATEDSIVQALPAPSPKAIQNSNASYLITGGTGGLGRSITRWLAREGAKNIILASRSGSDQTGVNELVEELRALDVHVHVERCDVAQSTQVQRMISSCQEIMPPIRGVIHGAMALRDVLFEKISYADWSLNIKPRVDGAWNLHNVLLDTELDFFVMLASESGFIGRAGQAAYAASNTFLDSFAAYRNQLDLPGSTIDIGFVEDVGYVAENPQRHDEIANAMHDQLSEAELLALVKGAITNPLGENSFQQTLSGLKLRPDKELPPWASDPKLVHVLHKIQDASVSHDQKKDGMAVRQQLKQADTWQAATCTISEGLCQKLSSLLMMSADDDINAKKPIVAYGLDSLAAVELRNWISGELEANVPLMELMNSPSIENLSGKIASKSRLIDRSLCPDGATEGKE